MVKLAVMERQSPFAEVMHWKRLIGAALIVGGAAAGLIIFGGEGFDGLDLGVGIVGGRRLLPVWYLP